MIVSVNSKPDLIEFKNLMLKTDRALNEDAKKRPKYYATRGGNPLEDDVKSALEECAQSHRKCVAGRGRYLYHSGSKTTGILPICRIQKPGKTICWSRCSSMWMNMSTDSGNVSRRS